MMPQNHPPRLTNSMPPKSPPFPAKSSSRRMSYLSRGQACINCRHRKIKCDGTKPKCGQCRRSGGSFDDCEYATNGPSRTQILEENIARLQSRIRELEKDTPKAPVYLHHPYYSLRLDEDPDRDMPISDFAVETSSTGDITLPYLTNQSMNLSESTFTTPDQLAQNGTIASISQEPPREMVLLLLDNFVKNSWKFGFFLDVHRFYRAALLPYPLGHYDRPSPALLSAVYLWGARLSPSVSHPYNEQLFLHNTLYYISQDLAGCHPKKIIHALQAEILVSYYYLHIGRLQEGSFRASSAVGLCYGAKLHRIRSPKPPYVVNSADLTEEEEQINGFWTAVTLNSYWVAHGFSSAIALNSSHVDVDTPWPTDIGEYGRRSPPQESADTLQRFLDNTNVDGFSFLALHAKASILLERAITIGGRIDQDNVDLALTSVFALDELIEQFRSNLPLLDQIDIPPSSRDVLVIISALTDGATIKLHLPLVQISDISRNCCLSAAMNILKSTKHMAKHSISQIVDPILGVLWRFACEALIANTPVSEAFNSSFGIELLGQLRKLLELLAVFSVQSPVIG
ncbi:hypothetical protein BD779DRAFT_1544381 [Infundibulicybe gibba]|nr:hypothetical protein BD779DRAFT_1544381 [Infundibulicybe gibba]